MNANQLKTYNVSWNQHYNVNVEATNEEEAKKKAMELGIDNYIIINEETYERR